MKLPKLSNLVLVAELRYIQSVHEEDALRNPDSKVGDFLPLLRRLRFGLLSRRKLAQFRADPLYWYVLARTKHYDQVFADAIRDQVKYIINIGAGSDTRAHRFAAALQQNGITVLECDQPDSIEVKRSLARRQKDVDHIAYASIDINDESWPALETWLDAQPPARTLVVMEGVSPYINAQAFAALLELLAAKLVNGSRVAYDFKLKGVDDDFGREGRTQRPFRLPGDQGEVAAFHEELGYRVNHLEASSELRARVLEGLAVPEAPVFTQDGLVRLEVAKRPGVGRWPH